MPSARRDEPLIFEIREHLGEISNARGGWKKELNLVCWNGQEPPKFDIRAWSEDHRHMGKGVTMYSDEMRRMVSLFMSWSSQRVVDEARERDRRSVEDYRQRQEDLRFQQENAKGIQFSEEELNAELDASEEADVSAEETTTYEEEMDKPDTLARNVADDARYAQTSSEDVPF